MTVLPKSLVAILDTEGLMDHQSEDQCVTLEIIRTGKFDQRTVGYLVSSSVCGTHNFYDKEELSAATMMFEVRKQEVETERQMAVAMAQ